MEERENSEFTTIESEEMVSQCAHPSAAFNPPLLFNAVQLEIMDPYMPKGQKCVTGYTNPDYFVQTWLNDMQKKYEEAMRAKAERKKERLKKSENGLCICSSPLSLNCSSPLSLNCSSPLSLNCSSSLSLNCSSPFSLKHEVLLL